MRNTFILLTSTLILSCGDNQGSSTESSSSEASEKTVVVEDKKQEVALGEMKAKLKNGEESSELFISYQFYSNPDSSYKKNANELISKFVYALCTNSEPPSKFGSLDTNFLRAQLNSFIQTAKESAIEYEETIPWEMEMSFGIDTTQFGSIEVHTSTWYYTGGAHGLGESNVNHFDIKSGRELNLQDYFKDIDQLNRIGEKYFRIAQELDPNESLEDAGFEFYDGFYVSNNFSFDSKTMYVGYNVYEIGPYVMGAVDFEIPLSEIKSLLKK